MRRLVVIAAIAAGLIGTVGAADAGTRHRHKHHHDSRMHHHGRVWSAPVYLQRPAGPPWSGPNQCWEDLGYGRYESCDVGN